MKSERKQVNIRIEPALFRSIEAIARQERRSVPQAAKLLLEEGLRRRLDGRPTHDDVLPAEIAALADVGGAFDWLSEEPDLYDDTCGEPI